MCQQISQQIKCKSIQKMSTVNDNFYDELDKMDELILETFLENDLLDSPFITFYEQKEETEFEDVEDDNKEEIVLEKVDSDCSYCDTDYDYEYCSCDDDNWETIRYKRKRSSN